jgi:hypothetical protein
MIGHVDPPAADEVATAVCRVAPGEPLNGIVEVAGSEQFRFDQLIRRALTARHDPRTVVADPDAGDFGAKPGEGSLVPGDGVLHCDDGSSVPDLESSPGTSTDASGPQRRDACVVIRPERSPP